METDGPILPETGTGIINGALCLLSMENRILTRLVSGFSMLKPENGKLDRVTITR